MNGKLWSLVILLIFLIFLMIFGFGAQMEKLNGMMLMSPKGWETKYSRIRKLLSIYPRMFVHQQGLAHLLPNLIFFLIMSYFLHRYMGDQASMWLLLFVIIAPIYGSVTLFVWKPNVNSFGFSGIIYAMAGGLLSLLIVRWNKFSKRHKIELILIHCLFFASNAAIIIKPPFAIGHTYNIGAYIAGMLLVWGFYNEKYSIENTLESMRFYLASIGLIGYFGWHLTQLFAN